MICFLSLDSYVLSSSRTPVSPWKAELAVAVSTEGAGGAGEAGRAEKYAGGMNKLGRRAEMSSLGANVQLGL